MALYQGTTGTDTLVGADNVSDTFDFASGEWSAADSVDGGASTVFPSAVDHLWLTDGVYVSSDLANVTGIESIALYGTGQPIVGTDLLDQASSGALLFVTAAIGTQTIDASQSGTPANGFASKLVQGALGAHAYPTGAQLFAQGKIGMMALGSWWMQESKFPPPLSPFVQNMDGFDFFYFPALPGAQQASPPVGGIDIGYGLTNNGAKNKDAWVFLASLTNGEALQEALNDLNDLPAFAGHEPKGDVSDHIKAMFVRFMTDLPRAENQRLASPAVSDALENALAGVAAGSLEPAAALKAVQAATDKALAK